MPGEGRGRGRHAVSGFCLASGARRQERPVAGMVAKAPDFDRAAADQCAGRYHQLHDLRPRPAAACVRRGKSARQSHRAPRARWRDLAGAGRPRLHPRHQRLRDCRRARRRIARRHHGRRGLRLLGSNHRRADRIGAVERDQHRADRAQARHQFGRALPLRARRRSGLHAAGAGDGHPAGHGAVRRHALGKCRRRQRLRRGPRDRFSADRGQAPRRDRRAASGDETHPRPSRLHDGRPRPGGEGRGTLLAIGRARQGRHRRGDRAHCRRRQGADDAVRALRRASRFSPRSSCVPAAPSVRSPRAAWSKR